MLFIARSVEMELCNHINKFRFVSNFCIDPKTKDKKNCSSSKKYLCKFVQRRGVVLLSSLFHGNQYAVLYVNAQNVSRKRINIVYTGEIFLKNGKRSRRRIFIVFHSICKPLQFPILRSQIPKKLQIFFTLHHNVS